MDISVDQTMLESVDARTRLAGSNKMEILLFSLGTSEVFGINVFKVKEVTKTPAITRTPNMPQGVEGVISLRGRIVPVVSLGKLVRIDGANSANGGLGDIMMMVEYSRHVLGFLVHSVDRIIRVDWDKVKAPDAVLAGDEGLVTAITELTDGRLVSILDVEQILEDTFGETLVTDVQALETDQELTVFFVDDSVVARKKIVEVLEKMNVRHKQASNGVEALEKLRSEAAAAVQAGVALSERIRLIMVDAEMPEMDGYVLTRELKADNRFDGIPVVMHSSLSSEANKAMGKSVGVDAYVAKFDGHFLAETLRPLLTRTTH